MVSALIIRDRDSDRVIHYNWLNFCCRPDACHRYLYKISLQQKRKSLWFKEIFVIYCHCHFQLCKWIPAVKFHASRTKTSFVYNRLSNFQLFCKSQYVMYNRGIFDEFFIILYVTFQVIARTQWILNRECRLQVAASIPVTATVTLAVLSSLRR